MRLEEKLSCLSKEEIWNEYCSFLDLNLEQYMRIQERLMQEQIQLWSNSGIGKKIIGNKQINSIDEFRAAVPLTTYSDYADVLLPRRGDMLPAEPVLWLQTTWEGGKNPIKVAPYSKGMLDIYKNNMIACMMLSTSKSKGHFDVSKDDTCLYALAPLPFATGLMPVALNEEIAIEMLPSVKDAVKMSFSERNKAGFKLGMSQGIDFFFGLGSVTYFVSKSLGSLGGGKTSIKDISPQIALRYTKAKLKCKKENREMLPKDLFKLKGFMVAGTDNNCYKNDLEELWGVRPTEIFGGTEPSCMGTEGWNRDGMYFFPDTCFYEFIPEEELKKQEENLDYKVRTLVMDQVEPGEKYELVISVLKGGAFARYRVGDMYQCIDKSNPQEGTNIPRFKYLDRVSSVIDIGGFTRITKNSIDDVIDLSGIEIQGWVAAKELNDQGKPYLHLYIEPELKTLASRPISTELIKDHLSVYFKYVDQDYKDLKKILGMDPLKVTIIKCGTMEKYQQYCKKAIRKMNPQSVELDLLLKLQEDSLLWGRDIT